ncbi:MAG: hypothetical protein GY705_27275 [Bacteroidetes bacterium]|nr:hypothetical protein [Bacteroidota bacterium]
MKALPKIIFAIASLALLMLFVFPMWKITLEAPQYPENLDMYIWVNNITGEEDGTLQNINIMNHYVGMKDITVEGFSELVWMQYVVLGMVALGLIFVFIGNRKLYLFWALLLIVLGTLGIYDFYLWEYDYGHNLDPNAAIIFEGMAYQPPLIGSKTLLNFVAHSWPWVGGWFIAVSIILGLLAWWLQKKKDHAT